MENDILEMLMPHLTERLGELLRKDPAYCEAVRTEELLFKLLNDMMTEEPAGEMTEKQMKNHLQEQKDLLMQYCSAAQTSVAIIKKKSYRQGMKDMLELLTVLSKKDDCPTF